MKLDVIRYEPEQPAYQTPLLFIHGAWHGAWCWEKYFLPYFKECGYRSYALSLRGHGKSEGKIHGSSIMNYVADVAQVAATIQQETGKQPTLIGHSMGGLVTQKYLENRKDVPAAVLLASVPVGGVLMTTLRIARHRTLDFLWVNLTLNLYPLVDTPEKAKWAMFSESMPDDEAAVYQAQMNEESYLAYLGMIFNLPRPSKISTPVLVCGARGDHVFAVKEVERTAARYGGQARIFDMAHDMMLEAGWKQVAAWIGEWLKVTVE